MGAARDSQWPIPAGKRRAPRFLLVPARREDRSEASGLSKLGLPDPICASRFLVIGPLHPRVPDTRSGGAPRRLRRPRSPVAPLPK